MREQSAWPCVFELAEPGLEERFEFAAAAWGSNAGSYFALFDDEQRGRSVDA
jgi:hypothetical protein